jgi:hypothetical protein
MSASPNERRLRGLAYVRRRIEAGHYTKTDLVKWEKELGPQMRELVPPAAAAAEAKTTTTTKKGG